MTRRAIGLFVLFALAVSACGADTSASSSQHADSSTTSVVATTAAPSTTSAPGTTVAPTTTVTGPTANLVVDLGVLSGATLELYATDQVAGSIDGPQLGLLRNQSDMAGFDVDPGVYDVNLTHDGASVILDNFDCSADRCERADPKEIGWQITDSFSAVLVYGFVEQMHDLSPYLGGVWVSEDQETLYVSVAGDVVMRTGLLRLAGFDVDSPHVEVVQANYTMVELEAASEAIAADADILTNQYNAHSRQIDIINNVVVVSTSDTDTVALAAYLGNSYPADMVTVEGGVEPTVFTEA